MAFIIVSAVAAPLAAQDAGGRTSGGGTQRQNSLDLSPLRESPDDADKREKLLKDIQEAIAGGDTSDEIYIALEYMSREGLSNRTMRNNKVSNDHPQIRRKVALELAKMGTARATDILIQLCKNENVPYVQYVVIYALGDIGINENDTTVTELLFKLRGFNERPADGDVEQILLAAIEAFDKIDKKNDGLGNRSKEVQEFLGNVARNKRFPRRQNQPTLDERAKQVLEDIIKRESQRKQGS
jgi:HEAT repeat protein